ncbi:hypothetical protein P3S68_011393 [Capsicum galapagoense]
MFQEKSPRVKDKEKSTRPCSVRHVMSSFFKNQEDSIDKASNQFEHGQQGQFGVSPERDQAKSVPSSTITHEGTSKLTLDMEEIKTYINYYVDKKIGELVIVISNIPVEDEKMVDMEQGREESKKLDSSSMEDLPHEDEAKGPLTEITNDDPIVIQPVDMNIQACVSTNI